MKHTSSYVHILMSGHNPEHQKHKHNHNISHETHTTKPCDILMRQHHYNGGLSAAVMPYSHGGSAEKNFTKELNPHKTRKFSNGGHVDNQSRYAKPYRERHYAGGISNAVPNFSKGGDVNDKYESKVGYEKPSQSPYARTMNKGGKCYAEGGETKKEYGNKPVTGQLRRGGRAKYHSYDDRIMEGHPVSDNSVRSEKSSCGRTKRQHHYWGQDFIGRLPLIGNIANSIAHTVGTLDPHQYGGAKYKADSTGKKVADVAATIGNLVPMAASFLKKGGSAHKKHRYHHAMGGSGKVRKGMMTNSGRTIHSDIE